MIFLTVLHAFTLGILAFAVVNSVLNAWKFPTAKAAPWNRRNGDPPKVSILVPARNEERCIRDCVRSLQRQNYTNYEVIVLDDSSQDQTRSLILKEGFKENEESRFRLIRGQPLAKGWGGKPWACFQLSQEAKGDYFLFTDADTVHRPEMLGSVMNLAVESKAHLLSAWPKQITKTWSEMLIIPLLYVFGIGFGLHWLLALLQKNPTWCRWIPKENLRQMGMANGQFILFERQAYHELGTHERVKNHLVEDVALGRAAAAKIPEGWRLLNCDGRHIVSCRMYENFLGVWEGFSKNIRPAFENAFGLFLFTGFVLLFAMVMPFVWLFVPGHFWIAMIEIQMVILFRLVITVRFGTNWWSMIFNPFAVALALAIGLNSWRWAAKGNVRWKQRAYEWKSE